MNELEKRLAQLTPEQRALLAAKLKNRPGTQDEVIRRQQPGEPAVLSFAQQQLWFLEQLSPGNVPYNVPIYVRLNGELRIEAFRRALQTIVQRHEVLRRSFASLDGVTLPPIPPAPNFNLKQYDLRRLPMGDREAKAQRVLKLESSLPFDFSRDLMFRAILIQLGDHDFCFLHNAHHVAWDLGSKTVFYRELEALYQAYLLEQPCPLPELPIQYSDYAAWQRGWLQGDTLNRLGSYWKGQLSGAPMKLELPADHPRPPAQTLRGAKRGLTLDKPTLDAARQLTTQSGVTLYVTMLAAFAVFLSSYSGQDDILIGSPVDGRERPEVRDLIGFFINTVVLRIRVPAHVTFRELLRDTQEVALGAMEHSKLPFSKVVEIMRPPRDLSRSPLFQVNFRLQQGAPVTLRLPGLTTEGPYVVDNAAAKFDLALELPSREGGAGYWEYSADLFEPSTIDEMDGNFGRLLATLFSAPDLPLRDHDFRRLFRGRHAKD